MGGEGWPDAVEWRGLPIKPGLPPGLQVGPPGLVLRPLWRKQKCWAQPVLCPRQRLDVWPAGGASQATEATSCGGALSSHNGCGFMTQTASSTGWAQHEATVSGDSGLACNGAGSPPGSCEVRSDPEHGAGQLAGSPAGRTRPTGTL